MRLDKRQQSSIFDIHANLTRFVHLFGEELFLVASYKYVREGGEDMRVVVGVREQAECVRGGRGQVTPGQTIIIPLPSFFSSSS